MPRLTGLGRLSLLVAVLVITPGVIGGMTTSGAAERRAEVQKTVESLGGHLDAFYFVFGENDVHIILDLPENLTAAAISLAVMSTGAARMKTTVLLTPEEMDQAAKTPVDYRPPGVARSAPT